MENEPTIIRAASRRDNPYFMMTRDAAQDERLSFEARGLLCYLLSKPDNWSVRITDLRNAAGPKPAGRDKVYALLKELKDAGYVTRNKRKGDNGVWIWEPYYVFETPSAPYPDLPDTVKPEIIDSTESYIIQSLIAHPPKNETTRQKLARVARVKRANAKLYAKWGTMQPIELRAELTKYQNFSIAYPKVRAFVDYVQYLEMLLYPIRPRLRGAVGE